MTEGVKHIHEGLWYRFHSDKRKKHAVSWRQWVKAGVSGAAQASLDYEAITPLAEISLCAESDWREENYFIPASFEKAERLENQLARERKEKEMKGGKLWVAPPVMLLRL